MVSPAPALLPPNATYHFTEKDGKLSNTGRQLLQQIRSATNGLTPIIPCTSALSNNVVTLTPFAVSPAVANYYDYFGFAFMGPTTSTGTLSMTVTPQTGLLATLPLYKGAGFVRAGANDIQENGFYIAHYSDALNSGNGGFTLTSSSGAGQASIQTHTSDYAVLAVETGTYFDDYGAGGLVVFSLPTATRGLIYTFTGFGTAIQVVATGGALIDFDGTPGIPGGNLAAGAGSSVTLLCLSPAVWISTAFSGPWVLT